MKISVPTAAHPAHAFTLAAGYLSGWTSLDVTGIPWHRNNHRSWSLETAYTYTNAIYRISFGVRYIYGYDDYAHTAKIYDQYATYWQCRIFSTGGCNHMHYIAPEIGAASGSPARNCCCANGSVWA